MVYIPRLHFHNDEEGEEQETQTLGIRTLRKTGGSVVVTIPPKVLDLTNMEPGDDVVIHVSEVSISLTKLPEQNESEPDRH